MELEFGKKATLNDLEKQLSLAEKNTINEKVLFNFSKVNWFNVDALLMLIIAIYSFSSKGIDVKIMLPEGYKDPEQKARDFLKRWGFFKSLSRIFGADSIFFEDDQLKYLQEKQKFYLPSTMPDEWGNMKDLYSSNVIEINHLTSQGENGESISPLKIKEYLTHFSDKRLVDALKGNLDLKKETIESFVMSCIVQPIKNAKEHAKATIGLIAAQATPKNFIISIVDNGLGIPTTIKPIFEQYVNHTDLDSSDTELIKYAFAGVTKKEMHDALQKVDDTELINYATQPGVTSKSFNRGMGLFLLKTFVKQIGGSFIARSGNGSVKFEGTGGLKPRVVSEQSGTLIVIYVPLKHGN